MLLHVLGHVDADHRPLVVEEELGEGPRQLGLAHAGGAEEEEGADGAVGVGEARPRPPHRIGHRHDGLALADHALREALLHLHELLHLGLEEARHRDARPLGHRLGDVLLVHLFLEHAAVPAELGEARVLRLELLLEPVEGAVAQLGRLLEVAAPLRLRHGLARRLHLLLDLADGQDGGLLRASTAP